MNFWVFNNKVIIIPNKPVKKTVEINEETKNNNNEDRFTFCQRTKKLFEIKRRVLLDIKHIPISRTIIAHYCSPLPYRRFYLLSEIFHSKEISLKRLF